MTHHPVSLRGELSIEQQIKNAFEAISHFDILVIATAPNIEVDSQFALELVKSEVLKSKQHRFCFSLGFKRYHSFLVYVQGLIGNSSSKLLEAPYYRVPEVNIGDRQRTCYTSLRY